MQALGIRVAVLKAQMSNLRKERAMPEGINRNRSGIHLPAELSEFRSWVSSRAVQDKTKDLLGILGFLLLFTLFVYMLLH